jgi:hypothetical protein
MKRCRFSKYLNPKPGTASDSSNINQNSEWLMLFDDKLSLRIGNGFSGNFRRCRFGDLSQLRTGASLRRSIGSLAIAQWGSRTGGQKRPSLAAVCPLHFWPGGPSRGE